jgi:hypothetical protein
VNEAIKLLWQANAAGCTHHSLFQSSRDGAHIFLTVGLSFAGAGGKNKYSFKCGLQPKPSHHGHLTLSPDAIVGMCMVFNPISNSFGLNSRILPLGLNNYLLRYPR